MWNTENIASVLEDQIQYSRRNCLVVSGIAEQRGENTDEIIKSFAAEKLGIELDHADMIDHIGWGRNKSVSQEE